MLSLDVGSNADLWARGERLQREDLLSLPQRRFDVAQTFN